MIREKQIVGFNDWHQGSMELLFHDLGGNVTLGK